MSICSSIKLNHLSTFCWLRNLAFEKLIKGWGGDKNEQIKTRKLKKDEKKYIKITKGRYAVQLI